jgi:hypothetical protein
MDSTRKALGVSSLVASILLSAAATGLAAPPPPSYKVLLERVKQGDTKIDFTALRMAWAAARDTGSTDPELRKKMSAALHQHEWTTILELGNQVFAANYLDINAHMFVGMAYEKTGKPEQAAFHRAVGEGLRKSILASGNGHSIDTAFVVVSVDEEYALLKYFQLLPGDQTLVNVGNHNFDKLTTHTQSGDEAVVYFNVDAPMARLAAELAPR